MGCNLKCWFKKSRRTSEESARLSSSRPRIVALLAALCLGFFAELSSRPAAANQHEQSDESSKPARSAGEDTFVGKLDQVELRIRDYGQQIDLIREATRLDPASGSAPERQARSSAPERQARSSAPEKQARSSAPEKQARSSAPEKQADRPDQLPAIQTARRARQKVRNEVIGELTGWEKIQRKTARAVHYLPPGQARDAEILLTAAQRQAMKRRVADIGVLQTIALDMRRTHAGVVGQAGLIVQLAQYTGEAKTAQKEREYVVDEAKKPKNQSKVRDELKKTDDALEDSLGMGLKNNTKDDFHRLKGTLRAPVSAEIAVGYGPQKQPNSMSYVRHTGLTWQVDEGTAVQTVAPGLVVFAGRMEGFGELVIIDHGQKYHSVYAHLKSLDVRVGQALQRSAQIGLSGQTGSFDGPKLYFELRKNGHPIDPTPWFLQR